MWSLIKPFLHQVTIDKVHIYGTNTEEWKAALLEEIDADQLPAYYGGTLTDPDGDPRCPSKVNQLTNHLLCCIHHNLRNSDRNRRKGSKIVLHWNYQTRTYRQYVRIGYASREQDEIWIRNNQFHHPIKVEYISFCTVEIITKREFGSRWCFMTDNADIGFRIFYKNKAGEEVAVLCNQRVDSHVTMEEGAILCNNQCSCNINLLIHSNQM